MLDRIEIGARDGALGTVIWLHGLGASGDDFAPIVPMLRLPHLRFILPHAPEMPVTINNGWVMPAWYDILTLSGPGREDAAGLRASADAILTLVDHELDRGVPAERIALIGFSQGGAVVVDLITRCERRFAGAMVLSSYMVEPEGLDGRLHAANAETPVWFAHGTHDDVVPIARGRATCAALAERGRPATFDAYRMGHEVCDEELRTLRAKLAAWLPNP
jgi:phospholipase/carboxylesterase